MNWNWVRVCAWLSTGNIASSNISDCVSSQFKYFTPFRSKYWHWRRSNMINIAGRVKNICMRKNFTLTGVQRKQLNDWNISAFICPLFRFPNSIKYIFHRCGVCSRRTTRSRKMLLNENFFTARRSAESLLKLLRFIVADLSLVQHVIWNISERICRCKLLIACNCLNIYLTETISWLPAHG